MLTARAAGLEQGAVQLEHVLGAGPLVEAVDVLSDDPTPATRGRPALLQGRDRLVRLVGTRS